MVNDFKRESVIECRFICVTLDFNIRTTCKCNKGISVDSRIADAWLTALCLQR